MAVVTLWDRYEECRRAGLAGIPRAELLRHLELTATTLDRMTQKRHQHVDIKPDNLHLSNGHVKLADLDVNAGDGMGDTVRGGVTPMYAAPETFDGTASHQGDQYSLAIVYQELLTGRRPFNGTTMAQIVMQHLKATPDLSSLPPGDQAAVGRALSKRPEDRYPNCLQFIKALQGNVG